MIPTIEVCKMYLTIGIIQSHLKWVYCAEHLTSTYQGYENMVFISLVHDLMNSSNPK